MGLQLMARVGARLAVDDQAEDLRLRRVPVPVCRRRDRRIVQGRNAAARATVELTQGDTQVVWQGQLDYCRGELAASGQG